MIRRLLIITLTVMAMTGCHDVPDYVNDPMGNFTALWRILDEHYCYFEEKGVDWDKVYADYSRRISPEMTSDELFGVCSEMLDELRDGHVNLMSAFNVSYYHEWWSAYPQNYDRRLVEECYFNYNYRYASGLTYGILNENVGYIRYSSFSSPIGEGNLDAVLTYLATCSGLIIDIRDNGGGDMTNVETLVGRFITERTLAGYISHKTGPGHNEFSEPMAYYYNPAVGRVLWGKPVVVLTNRSTYSAANNFASVMSHLPSVRIVGDTTGGGSGMPFSSELPCGWGVRFSACPIYDSAGKCTETGIEPSEGCHVDLDPIAALNGHDTMLDFAINLITTTP